MTAQRKKGSAAAFLIGLALALALGIAVLSTLVWCVGTHDGLMARWMLETAPPGDTGLPAAAYAPLCKALCSYLRGGTSVFDFLQGGVSLFNTSEKLHLADCAALFRFDHQLMVWSWAAAGVLLVLLLVCRGAGSAAGGLLTGTLLVVAGVAGLIIWGAADFGGLFLTFHRVAFSNDLWMMNPATDLILRLMPTGFFVRYALVIGGAWLLAELAVFWLARWLKRLAK